MQISKDAATGRRPRILLVAAVVGAAVLGCGAWFVKAKSNEARKEIVRALREAGLSDVLRYKDISVSAFGGSASLEGARLETAQFKGTAERLVLSDFRKGENLPIESLRLRFEGLKIPVADNSRALGQLLPVKAADLLALGYNTISGTVEFSFNYRPGAETLRIDLIADLEKAARLQQSAELGGVTDRLMNVVAKAISPGNDIASHLGSLMQTAQMAQRDLVGLTLREYRTEIRDQGAFDRLGELWAYNNRAYGEDASTIDAALETRGGKQALVEQIQADIRNEEVAETIANFLTSGGHLEIQTKLDQPLPFFRGSNDSFLGITLSRELERPDRMLEDKEIVFSN